MGQDRCRGRRSVLQRAGRGARRRRCRSADAGDVPRCERNRRRHRRGEEHLRAADRCADDNRRGRQQPRRHTARAVRAGVTGSRC